MANNIGLVSKYGAESLDEIFTKKSVTSVLEGNAALLKFDGAKTVYIPDITMDGLGDYSRSTGFPTGDVNVTWTAHTLTKDRAKSFTVDAMDDEESAGVAFGALATQFMKDHVVPEVDAYRLSTLLANAASGNITSGETIATNAVLKRFNADKKLLLDNEVEPEECVRFISSEVAQLIEDSTELSRVMPVRDYTADNGVNLQVKVYNGIPLIEVPAKRFYSAYTFGTSGFTKTSDAVAINFLTVHKNAAICVKKHEKVRVFSPDVNQDADAWKFQYRLYHDIFTPKNKQVGITGSTK